MGTDFNSKIVTDRLTISGRDNPISGQNTTVPAGAVPKHSVGTTDLHAANAGLSRIASVGQRVSKDAIKFGTIDRTAEPNPENASPLQITTLAMDVMAKGVEHMHGIKVVEDVAIKELDLGDVITEDNPNGIAGLGNLLTALVAQQTE